MVGRTDTLHTGAMTAVTWWGHSFATVELPDATVATDPLMARRLFHLRRPSPPPGDRARRADLVLVSHLHHDHLHVPTLRRFDDAVPIVVPRGAVRAVRSLERLAVIEVVPGDDVTIAGVDVEVLPACHDGRRDKRPGAPVAPALGFRFSQGGTTCWHPGDTGPMDFSGIDPVDLALVPIGGWGPSLGDGHLDPEQAADAVAAVGARWILPVHHGTYWPVVLRPSGPAHEHWFISPPQRFREAVAARGLTAEVLTPPMGVRLPLERGTMPM